MVNYIRSLPAPPSLAIQKQLRGGKCTEQDVINALDAVFKGKCYICEQKDLTAINVEHLISHRNDINLKFDWNNLFLSCVHCNNIKHIHYDDILDCTNTAVNVDEVLKMQFDSVGNNKVTCTPLGADPSIIKTAELLNKVYAGETAEKKLEAGNIKKKINEEIMSFRKTLVDFYDEHTTAPEKSIYKQNIEGKLLNSSKFASFKRWIVRAIPTCQTDFIWPNP